MPITKLGARKVTKMFGKLNPANQQRVREMNLAQGKTLESYMDGVSRGKENLSRITNTPITKPNYFTSLKTGGYYFHPGKGKVPRHIGAMNPNNPISRFFSPLHKVFDTPESRRAAHQMGLRHEGYEALASRGLKNHVVIGKRPEFIKSIADKLKQQKDIRLNIAGQAIGEINNPVGVHNSLNVLGREANDFYRAGQYISTRGSREGVQRLQGARERTGENKILQGITGKTPGKELLTRKDLKSLTRASQLPASERSSPWEAALVGPKPKAFIT